MLEGILPRSLSDRWSVVTQDARALRGRLRGERPAPFQLRGPQAKGAAVAASPGLAVRELRVVEVVSEGPEAVRIVLEDAQGAPIPHRPGQFFTLLVDVGGEVQRRAYSIAWSSTDQRRVAIGVKRVAGGRVSGQLVEGSRAGQVVRVLGPSGDFGLTAGDGADAVLIAGGSGITPLLRIASSLLERDGGPRVAMVLGNRRAIDVMFRAELDALAARFPERFTLRHVLDDLAHGGGLGGATAGPLDGAALGRALDTLPLALGEAAYFVCGPTPMMDEARTLLGERGVPTERVREERFLRPELRAAEPTSTQAQPVTFRLRAGERPVIARPGVTLLDAGLEAGLDLPYSCAMGGCGACRVRLTQGDVSMAEPNCLDAAERAEGWVLACVATPRSAVSVEVEG